MTMNYHEKNITTYPGYTKVGFGWNLIHLKINPVLNYENKNDFTKVKTNVQTAHTNQTKLQKRCVNSA